MPDKALTHLSLFTCNDATQEPLGRMPVYAEVVLPRSIPTTPISRGLQEPYGEAGGPQLDPDGVLWPVLREVMSNRLTPASASALAGNYTSAVDFFTAALEFIANALDGRRPRDLRDEELRRISDAAVVAAARKLDLEINDDESDVQWTAPLGVLWSDHNGYLSYDLRRLPQAARDLLGDAVDALRAGRPVDSRVAVRALPYGATAWIDVLGQHRFANGAIVGRLPMIPTQVLEAVPDLGGASMQYPDLIDWQLSPSSFASNPGRLVGDDGCELLFPSSMPLHEFIVRQVIRLSDGDPRIAVPGGYRAAYVDEYRVTWTALGHSLGEILYSLPLAPGETVRLAVIDWSWESATKRDEKTVLTEELMHQTHRDRSITETVQAGLREFQHGSSFMGGYAHSGGASGGANLGIVSLGAAAGDAWSVGGSTATSEGSRDLVAENSQRLSDSFAQASASERELNSTIIVQARQDESETIETRTFTNYNHGHTLTILYYEVLRHYRLSVEWVRRRPAVLVPYTGETEYTAEKLLTHRVAIERALLDPSLAAGFSAIQKQVTISENQTLHGLTGAQLDTWNPVPWEGDINFSLFEFGIKTADGLKDKTDEEVWIYVVGIADDGKVKRVRLRVWEKWNDTENVDIGERFNDTAMAWFLARPEGTENVAWHQITGFEFQLHDSDEWRMDRLAITGFHAYGAVPLIDNTDVDFLFLDNGSSNTATWIRRPSPRPPAAAPTWSPKKALSPDEYRAANALIDHVKANVAHYNRAVLLATSTAAISAEFETKTWSGGKFLADVATPAPLDVFGTNVAYPLNVDLDVSQEELEKLRAAQSERLVSMPTRGVFGEGKLGHCSVAEEIDNTRFWKWEEHPIPIEAPEIAPVTPISPTPQQTPLSPTGFPSSLVNIVAPTPAPDPSGLAAALSAIVTPNVFRDMSGRAEVADLLKKLSDNTIGIAEAATKAQAIQTKYGADLDKNDKDLEAKRVEAAGKLAGEIVQATKPSSDRTSQEKAADGKKAEVSADAAKLEAAKEHLTPEQRKPVAAAVAKKWAADASIELQLNFSHGLSKQVLDGTFEVMIDGPKGQIEMISMSTSLGVARGTMPKWAAGDYGITVTGTRTKLPDLKGAVVTIPKVGTHEAFEVTLNKYIELQGLRLSGNGKLTLAAGTTRVVLSVAASEAQTTVTKEVDYNREEGVNTQAEFGLKAGLAGQEIASVGGSGTIIDVGTTGTKYAITIPFTYLTGGLVIS